MFIFKVNFVFVVTRAEFQKMLAIMVSNGAAIAVVQKQMTEIQMEVRKLSGILSTVPSQDDFLDLPFKTTAAIEELEEKLEESGFRARFVSVIIPEDLILFR